MSEDTIRSLQIGLRKWLQCLEQGNIRGALVLAGVWITELRRQMELLHTDLVPTELQWSTREKNAINMAIENRLIRSADATLWREYVDMLKRKESYE